MVCSLERLFFSLLACVIVRIEATCSFQSLGLRSEVELLKLIWYVYLDKLRIVKALAIAIHYMFVYSIEPCWAAFFELPVDEVIQLTTIDSLLP